MFLRRLYALLKSVSRSVSLYFDYVVVGNVWNSDSTTNKRVHYDNNKTLSLSNE